MRERVTGGPSAIGARIALAFGLVAASGAWAAPTLRYSVDQRGDMVIIGNTLGHECNTAPAPIVPGAINNNNGTCGTNRTDSGIDILWRSDAPSTGTAMADTSVTVADARSTAILAIPSGATITYARLYWAAHDASATADPGVTLERPSVFSSNITADDSFTATYSGGQSFYQGTADITSLTQSNGNGAYRLSGVSVANPLNANNEVIFAAWAMVVFYSLSTDPPRNLALFDGLDVVEPGSPASATVSGFLVPNTGYAARLGVIAYEGDNSLTGDTLRFNGTTLTNGANPNNNFFNATRSQVGSAVSVSGDLPQLSGAAGSMSGIDIDVVDVTSLLSPGATSATTAADSTQDVYLIGAMVTSISTLKPLFTLTTKSWADLNGGSVETGDTIEYTITTNNTGTDTATDVFITDALAAGITYVPGSLQIDGAPLTDASGDDRGEYLAASRSVRARIGSGANATQGGTIAPGSGATTVLFRVTVDADATGSIDNLAIVTATGQVGGQTQTFPSGNGDPATFIVAPNTTIVSGPASSTTSTSATFDFSSPSAGATFECKLDGAAAFTVCTDPVTYTGLSEASHTLQVRAVYSGVVDPSPASWTWTVDRTPPTVSFGSTPDAVSNATSADFTFSSNEGGVTYECRLDGAASFSACANPLALTGLVQGSHSLEVRAVDAAGNVSTSPASYSWFIDSIAPDAPVITSPASGAVVATSSPLVSGTAEPFARVSISLDGQLYGDVIADAAGGWLIALSGLAESTHQLSAIATDPAGNASPATVHDFSVDLTPPQTTIDSGPPLVTALTTATFTVSSNEAQVAFQCSLDGAAYVACPAPLVYSGLADGSHQLSVRAVDAAGNVDATPASHTWAIDSVPPQTAITSQPSNPSNQSSATFAFSASESPATFECSVDGGVWSTCTSASTFSGLLDGSHNFTVRATDAAGNVDATPATYIWSIDTVAPAPPVVTSPGSGAVVATSSPLLTGTAEPFARVSVSLDGQVLADVFADASGAWLVALSGLAESAHQVSLIATDVAGNASPATLHSFSVDLTPPETQIDSGPPALTAETTATFTVSSNEAPVAFECSLDGAAPAACPSPLTYPGLADGSHELSVRAVDAAGNVDPSPAQHNWTIDSTAPAAPSIASPASGTVIANALPTYSGTAEANTSVTISVDGSVVGVVHASGTGSWTFTSVVALPDGARNLEAFATDAAGNSGPAAAITFTIDTVAPNTAITSQPGNLTNQTSATFAFSADESPATFECRVDAGSWSACTSPATFTGLPDGSHVFEVRATDAPGNVDPTPASDTWVIDTVPPNTAITSQPSDPSTQSSASLAYSADEDPATFECRLDGSNWTPCATPSTYNVLMAGAHTFAVRATDAAGNVDPTPATCSWLVNGDTDGDGLLDLDELENGTDPTVPDTDGDGLPDGVEVASGTTSALDADGDDDGLLDGTEDANQDAVRDPNETDPAAFDTDGDGLSDGLELSLIAPEGTGAGTDPTKFVADADPATATDPLLADSDGDDLSEGAEDQNRNGRLDPGETDPLNPDSDRGGVPDGVERANEMDPTNDLDDWGVAGGGCGGCTSGGGPLGALGLLLVLAALRSRRRMSGVARTPTAWVSTHSPAWRRFVFLPALFFTWAPLAAQAQAPVSTAIDIQQFKPGPGARDVLALHSASVLAGDFAWSARLVSNFAAGPLRTVSPAYPSLERAIVQHQLTFDLLGSVAFRGRYELGVQLPLTIQGVAEGGLAGEPLRAVGLGDLRLVPKGRIWESETIRQNETIRVAGALPIVLPTGGAHSFLGGAGVALQPRAIVEWSRGTMRAIANLGLNFRSERTLHNLSVGNQFTYALGVDVPFFALQRHFTGMAMFGGSLGLGENNAEERPLELLAAVSWSAIPGLGVLVGGGPGLSHGYGTPTWRGMIGASWTR